MSRALSIYLDFLRFLAAIIVVLSHFPSPRLRDERWVWLRELNLGSDAVIIFFVLSGFVIAHSTYQNRGTVWLFAFNRMTRLVSVALPALLVGFMLDEVGREINPSAYEGWIYNPMPFWEVLLRGMTFSVEWGALHSRLGSNGPYWSLSYEFAYYVIFAIATYCTGARRILLLLLCGWIVGLNVLLLLPAWMIGVAAQKRITADRELPKGCALVYASGPVLLYIMAIVFDVPDLLRSPIIAFDTSLRYSDEFIWNNLLAVFVAIHLVGMAAILRGSSPGDLNGFIRWLAGGTFSIYIMHTPILQFIYAIGVDVKSVMADVVLLTFTIFACYVFASLTERRLSLFRRALRAVLSYVLRQRQRQAATEKQGLN